MRTDHPKEDPLVELGYEVRDVNYRTLGKAVIYFFAFAVASFAFGMYWYGRTNPKEDRQTLATIKNLNRPMPASPNPILQQNVNSKTDMARMRTREDEILHGTGPVEGTDKVHIPIDRAMELLVERGLPKTGAQVPAISQGNTTDGPKTVTDPQTTEPTTPEPTATAPEAPHSEPGAGH